VPPTVARASLRTGFSPAPPSTSHLNSATSRMDLNASLLLAELLEQPVGLALVYVLVTVDLAQHCSSPRPGVHEDDRARATCPSISLSRTYSVPSARACSEGGGNILDRYRLAPAPGRRPRLLGDCPVGSSLALATLATGPGLSSELPRRVVLVGLGCAREFWSGRKRRCGLRATDRATKRHTLTVSPQDREADSVSVAKTKRIPKMDLAVELDEIAWIVRLIGLERETAIPTGHQYQSEEVAGVSGHELPPWIDLRGREVPIEYPAIETPDVDVERAGNGFEPGDFSHPREHLRVAHNRSGLASPRSDYPRHVTV
jgi:hypothetical protein